MNNLYDVLYKDSGSLAAYDFFLKITKQEVAEKIEKLKLHQDGVFKRKFWEDLELSKNKFPKLRKLSIKSVKFNLFNLKYLEKTQIESFNFRNTAINKLEYIEFLLRENKRVIIGDDTACMAIIHAKKNKDYGFLTLAIQTGSWSRKNPGRFADELLKLSACIGHMEPMQKWADSITLPANTPEVIQNAISIIKHPMVIVITEGEEMLCVYADIVSNPIYKRIFDSQFSKSNCIQIPMSQDCLEKMTDFEIRNQLAPDIHLDTLIELARFAEMYFWEALKKTLRIYKVNCHEIWIDQTKDPIEMFDSVLADLIPSFPDFIKPSILRQVVRHLKLGNIEVFDEGCRVEFDAALSPMLNKLHHVHLRLDLIYINILKKNGPYPSVVSLEIVSDGLIDFLEDLFYDKEDLSTELMKQLFPSCVEFK